MTTDDYPAKEDTAWLFLVFITEFLLILIINAITITTFTRIRHLRKRSTYLIINLTVADLLVGAVTGPLYIYHNNEEKFGLTWRRFISLAFDLTFPIASQVNLCLISLDRLHATLFPFRHCLIRKCVYLKIIMGSWFITFILASLMASLLLYESEGDSYLWASFGMLTFIILVLSYVIIILNVQKSPHSQHFGSIYAERKLSVTLLIVTGVSVLTILPWAIYCSIPVDIQEDLFNKSSVDIHGVLAVIYFASSVVNPLVYAIRMQEFRKAIRKLVCKSTNPSRVHPLQLHSPVP
ncbi:melanocortin receptor 5-like [Oculina patagonica]